LIKRQSLLAVAFQRERFQRAARDVAAGDRKAFSDIIGNAEDGFRAPSLARGNVFSHFPVALKRGGRLLPSERQE
jgi:hypothetical protein